jgi:hypothetical protein
MESKGPKTDMYGYMQDIKWKDNFILMIVHGMFPQIRSCCNANNYVAVACSYLSQRSSFVNGDEWSQRDSRSTFMGTSSVFDLMVENVYIDDATCNVFTERKLLQCP